MIMWSLSWLSFNLFVNAVSEYFVHLGERIKIISPDILLWYSYIYISMLPIELCLCVQTSTILIKLNWWEVTFPIFNPPLKLLNKMIDPSYVYHNHTVYFNCFYTIVLSGGWHYIVIWIILVISNYRQQLLHVEWGWGSRETQRNLGLLQLW